jgi:hypothetical protein
LSKIVIASLPRSASCWMSAALCAQGPLAGHEALHEVYKGNLSWDDIDASVGSDALVPSHQMLIPKGAKTFFLWRNPDHCADSLVRCNAYNYDHWVTQTLWAQRFIDLYKPEILNYNSLPQSVRRVCQVMEVDVDETVLEQFVNMRITNNKYPDSV